MEHKQEIYDVLGVDVENMGSTVHRLLHNFIHSSYKSQLELYEAVTEGDFSPKKGGWNMDNWRIFTAAMKNHLENQKERSREGWVKGKVNTWDIVLYHRQLLQNREKEDKERLRKVRYEEDKAIMDDIQKYSSSRMTSDDPNVVGFSFCWRPDDPICIESERKWKKEFIKVEGAKIREDIRKTGMRPDTDGEHTKG